MTLTITLDAAAPEPPSEQLRAQVAEQARSGTLPAGYRMPTVRALAGELGIAPNTVAKAYRTLEADGVVETRGRHGTFVAAAGGAAERRAAEAAQEFARTTRRLGLSRAQAEAAARDALAAVHGRPAGP